MRWIADIVLIKAYTSLWIEAISIQPNTFNLGITPLLYCKGWVPFERSHKFSNSDWAGKYMSGNLYTE